jgi:transposase
MSFQQTRPVAKHPGGRPSEYKPEYCQRVIDYMAQGYSLSAFAGSIRKSRETIYGWITTYPDFSHAVEVARAARLVPWEQKLRTSEKSGEVAATIFALKNTNAEEWREVRYANFEHNVSLGSLTDEQLLAIASGQQPAAVGAIDVQYNRLLERPKRYQPK